MPNATRRRTKGQVSGESIMIEAGWMLYHGGLNQAEIAKRLSVSRATVVNYLQEAREKGFIQISLAPEVLRDAELAARLRDKPITHRQFEALSHCYKTIFTAGSCVPNSHIVGSGLATANDLAW